MIAAPRKFISGTKIAFAAATLTAAAAVLADTLGPVRYDPNGDQLVITMIYDGTNPNHHFSFQWGRCRKVIDQLGGPAHQTIGLSIFDDQGNDAAKESFTTSVKVPLAGISCRPATVVLRSPPRQTTSIDIP